MDVWTLGEKLKKVNTEVEELKSRMDHMEDYLGQLTKVKDEAVQGKKDKSPSIRTRRRAAKKS